MIDETENNDGHGGNQVPNSSASTSRNDQVLKRLLDEIRTGVPAINALDGIKSIPLIQPELSSHMAEIIDRAGAATAMMQAFDRPAQDALARLATSVKMPEIIFPDVESSKRLLLQSDALREAVSRALEGINTSASLQGMLAAGIGELVKANLVIENPLRDYAQKIEESLSLQKTELQAHLASAFDSRKLLENVFQTLNPAVEAMRQMAAEQETMLARAMEPLRQYFRQEKEAAEAFLYAGFCMAPSMNSALVERVKTLHAQKKKNLIAQTIMRYYKSRNYARLKGMVSGWETNPLFAPRMATIHDAFDAHLDRRFTLSIPVLLMQIDGVVGDFARHYQIETNLAKKQMFTDTLDSIPSDWMRLGVHESVSRFVDATLYAWKDFKRLPLRNKERINRHLVLHGRQVNYANERNSLRLFLLLDAFSALRIEPQANLKLRRRKSVSSKPKPK
ncbi:MAG: hypothetical protein IT331_23480 [Anaerolineae bacterium]|nr:hypothetical protein [Anaerolineae bacterium]